MNIITMINIRVDAESLTNHRMTDDLRPVPLCLEKQDIVDIGSPVRRRNSVATDTQRFEVCVIVPAVQKMRVQGGIGCAIGTLGQWTNFVCM